MINRLLHITIYLIIGLSLKAQEDVKVYSKTKPFTFGEVEAFSVLIPEADYKDVEKAWNKYLKTDTKEKTEEISGEFFISKMVEKIAPDTIFFASYLKEYDGYINLAVAMKIGEAYINPSFVEEVYLPAKKYVRDFAVEQYRETVAKELKQEEKALNKLENELQALYQQEDMAVNQIAQWEREIVTYQDEIKLNEIDQSSKVLQIQAQKEVVYELQNAMDEEALKNSEKLLKEMEKDFDKLQKQNKNYYKKIDNNKLNISQAERAIIDFKKDQKLKQFDIEEQEITVRKLQNKLEGIN